MGHDWQMPKMERKILMSRTKKGTKGAFGKYCGWRACKAGLLRYKCELRELLNRRKMMR